MRNPSMASILFLGNLTSVTNWEAIFLICINEKTVLLRLPEKCQPSSDRRIDRLWIGVFAFYDARDVNEIPPDHLGKRKQA